MKEEGVEKEETQVPRPHGVASKLWHRVENSALGIPVVAPACLSGAQRSTTRERVMNYILANAIGVLTSEKRAEFA